RARTIAALLAARRAVAGEQGRTAAAGTLGGLAAAAPLADWHTASRLALSGMASALIRDAAFTVAEHPRKPLHGATVRLWDAVEAGRESEAAPLLADGRILAQPGTRLLAQTYAQLLPLLRLVVDGPVPADPAAAIAAACAPIANGELAGHVRMAWVAAVGDAEACRRLCAGADDGLVTTTSSLLALAPVRLALRAGDAELAGRWLALRRARGLTSPGDAALWLRLHLLRGDRVLAGRSAAAVQREAEAFDCRRRIEFELRCGGGPGALELVEAGLAGAGVAAPAAVEIDAEPFAGPSPAAAALRERLRRCAGSELPLALVGEPGCGRTAAARAVHAASARALRPFIVASAMTESDPLTAADGPFARARGGTLLLRDLAHLDPAAQVRLAQRIVGAGCRCMAALAPDEAARWHPALAAALLRLEVAVPPLRDRPDDLPGLAEARLATALGGRTPRLSAALRRTIAARPWPGNLPELGAAMERMAVFFPQAAVLEPDHLGPAGSGTGNGPARPHPSLARPGRLAELRRLFQARRRLTRAEVIASTGVAPATATADLRALVAEGAIIRHAPTPAPYAVYFTWAGAHT
ncbi:MAG: hypothetical protein RLZZ127_2947, partial [Planctomycetota bacterium]